MSELKLPRLLAAAKEFNIGQLQKVLIARALAQDTDLIILDEPTAGLDPVSSEILKNKIILEKEKGKLILITSHILSELDDMVTQIIYIQDGKLCFQRTLQEIQEATGQIKLTKAIASIMKQNNSYL